jgi:hypothetical protein
MFASCRRVMSAQTRGAVAVGRTFFPGVSPVQREEKKAARKNYNQAPAAARCHVHRADASAVPSPMFVSCRRVMSAQTRGAVAAEITFFPGVSPVCSDSKHRQEKNIDPRSSCCGPLPRSPRRRERRTVINVRVVSARCVCIDTGRGGSGEKVFPLQQPGWLRGTIF